QLVEQGLAVRPEQGGGNTLVGLFASGRIGTTPAGGYWVQGLAEGGMRPEQYDVQFFPKWRTQRHQFGGAGYAVMKTTEKADQAWEWIKFTSTKRAMELAFPTPATTPTRRSMSTDAFYTDGPEHWRRVYETPDRFPTSGPIPAPPQQAAVGTALIRNVSTALSGGPDEVARSLDSLDRELRSVVAEEDHRCPLTAAASPCAGCSSPPPCSGWASSSWCPSSARWCWRSSAGTSSPPPSSWAWRTSRTSPPTAASASPSPTPPCSWSSRCSPSSPSPCCWPCSCRGGCPAGCGSSSVRPSSSRLCSPPRASPS